MKLTVVFEDYRVQIHYANNHTSSLDFYTEGEWGNSTTIQAFTTAATNAGHNMTDYWAIQYHGGEQVIEFANGHSHQVISGNTGLSEYTSLVDNWKSILEEEARLAAIPTWDDIRSERDEILSASDKIVAWSVETGNAIPQDWTDYRQDLRDITDTYGAPTGNTELVVFADEPSWPTS